jgi:hypothetical protein
MLIAELILNCLFSTAGWMSRSAVVLVTGHRTEAEALF